MGLFGRLFKKDPFKELEKCETLLAKGTDLEKALKIASGLNDHETPDIASKAQKLEADIRKALIDSMIANADRSEKSGNHDDAADWLTSALPFIVDSVKRQDVEGRIVALRAEDEEPAAPLISASGASKNTKSSVEEDHDIDFEFHFEALIGMLTESCSKAYMDCSPKFHEAYVAFNDDRMDRARELYNELLEEAPDNPCHLVEGARMRMQDGDFEEAGTMLDRAWNHFDTDYLDESQTISVPILWSDAMLRQKKPEAVIDRLRDLANEKTASQTLCQVYALALENAAMHEEARTYLVTVGSRFDKNPNFRFLLAGVLLQLEENDKAIEVLDTVVGPSCAGGSCGTGAKHPASMRMLVSLLLERNAKGDLQKAGQILMHLEGALGGRLSRNDLLMTARYHRLCDDEPAALVAEAEAQKLSDFEESGLEQAAPSAVSAGQKAVL